MLAVSGRRERRHAHDRRSRGHLGDQRLGDVAQAQKVDRDDQRRVAYSGGDPGDVEERIDVPVDGALPRDRWRSGSARSTSRKIVDLEGRPAFVEPDHISPSSVS